jgi:hypothetical protein
MYPSIPWTDLALDTFQLLNLVRDRTTVDFFAFLNAMQMALSLASVLGAVMILSVCILAQSWAYFTKSIRSIVRESTPTMTPDPKTGLEPTAITSAPSAIKEKDV